MFKPFVYSWFAYWGLVLVLPVHSIYPNVVLAFVLQVGFVVLVGVGYMIVNVALQGTRMPDARHGQIVGARRIVRLSLYLSLLGFLFLIYDKLAIQGIDYSQGIAVAREQWRVLGEERGGSASSIWSALGYLIGSAYYVTLVVLLTHPQSFSNRERLGNAFATFLFALANSIITGGRSNFMLLAVFAIAAMSARKGLSIKNIFPTRRLRRAVFAATMCAMVYIVFVFYARAQASDESVSLYVTNFLPYMGLSFDTWYLQVADSNWVATVGNMSILVAGYLTHSLATFAAILGAPSEDKTILFSNVASILYKLGIVAQPATDWFLAGRFPSVPGALWHEFGPPGFVFGSLALGATAGSTAAWAARATRRLFPLGIYVMVASTLILTPYVFAPDFLSFPFVFTAFVILALVARISSLLSRAKLRAERMRDVLPSQALIAE